MATGSSAVTVRASRLTIGDAIEKPRVVRMAVRDSFMVNSSEGRLAYSVI